MATHAFSEGMSKVAGTHFRLALARTWNARHAFWMLLLAWIQASSVAAGQVDNKQTAATTLELVSGKPIERALSGGQSHSYRLTIMAGQYLHVVVDQRGIDVVVTLYAPDGVRLNEVDSPNGANGPEPLSWIAETAGVYCLQVRSLEKDAKPGKYEAKIETLRPSLPADIHRVRAEMKEAEAWPLVAEGTAESLAKAIDKLTVALTEWRAAGEMGRMAQALRLIARFNSALGNKQKALDYYNHALTILRQVGDLGGEAAILNNLGLIYDGLGDKPKALDCFTQALPIYRKVGDRRNEATVLNNIGGVYADLGEKPKALEYFSQALPIYRKVGDRRSEANILNNIGGVYDSLNEKQKALDYFTRALPLYREVGDRRGEATVLNNLGGIYDGLSEKQKALDYFTQALPIFQQLGDLAGQAAALNNIGTIYSDLGDKPKALGYHQRTLAIRQQLGDLPGQAITLNNIGSVYDDLGKKQEALDYYNRALTIRRQVNDRRGEATTLNNIGSVYSTFGEKQKALDYYNQALLIRQQVGDLGGQAITLNNIGSVYDDLGKKQEALDYFSQALPIYQQVGDRGGETATLSNIGSVYFSLGDRQKALDYYKQTLPIQRQIGDPDGEATSLNNIGRVQDALGDKTKALEYYSQALTIRQQIGDLNGQATTLNNIGSVHSALGDKQEALNYFNQALPILRQVGDRDGQADTLNNIGGVYNSLGDMRRALKYYSQALTILQQVGDLAGQATTLNNIGSVYDELGDQDEQKDKQKALEYFSQALRIRRQVGDLGGQGVTLNNIGSVYSELGKKREALDYLTEALPILRQVGDRDGEATTLNNIGLIYDGLGDKQKALEYYTQALPIRHRIGDHDGEATTLNNISAVYRDLGKLDEALTQIRKSLTIVESLRTKVAAQPLRASYMSLIHGLYEYTVDLLMRLHQQHPTEGFDAAALQASERGRARSLLELLNESHADITQGVEPALLARKRAVGQLLDDKAERLTRLLSGNHNKDQADAAKKEVDDLSEQYEQIEAEIRDKNQGYAALTQPQPLSLEQIQRLLDPDTLFLEYSLGTKRSYLWAVTQTSFKSYALPKASEIKAAAIELYQSLRSPGPVRKSRQARTRAVPVFTAAAVRKAEGLAGKLSAMLLSPVAAMLGEKRLVVVADGALQYLPFAALADPSRRARWEPLILRHEIVSLPSASVLAIQRRELDGRKPAPKTAIILADPVFSADDVRFKRRQQARAAEEAGSATNRAVTLAGTFNHTPVGIRAAITEPARTGQPGTGRSQAGANQNSGERDEPLYQLILKRAIRDVRLRTTRGGLPRLLGTRREGEAIRALVDQDQAKLIVDFAATRAAAESSEMSQYRYVLLATHGLLDSQNPELSALVFSLVDEQGHQQNGYLRAHQIFNLTLPAEVVVLSACRTGLGKDMRGEGLVGLTQGFMYAGAKRVVVSLWSVDDASTAELISRFYRGMLKEGKRPAEALRAAQIEMWGQKRWRSPYYWAPFVLEGEWR